MNKKQILSLIFLFALALPLVSCTTQPSGGDQTSDNAPETTIEVLVSTSAGLAYEVNSDGKTCTITGIGSCKETKIIIGEYIDEYKIVAIAQDAFSGNRDITSVTISDSVTSIGKQAFSKCIALKSVTIPNGVTNIAEAMFYSCVALESITIPEGVKSIGNATFCGCVSLKNVTVPDSVTSIGDDVFEECSSLEYNEYDNALYLGNDKKPYVCLIKAKSRDITSCNINNNTKVISNFAFYDCKKLKSIIIPESVTNIGDDAFNGCEVLESITIPNSVNSIGNGLFTYGKVLSDITFIGTKAEWSAIAKGEDWDAETGSYTIHCTDGDITK
jgi:hypothetical protein